MFTHLTVSGFRGLEHLDLSHFGRLNLLVGRNNSGKTTALEALFLLAGGSNPQLPLRINAICGVPLQPISQVWPLFFSNLNTGHPIRLDADFNAPFQHRALTIRPHRATAVPLTTTTDRLNSLPDSAESSTDATPLFIGLDLEYAWKDQPDQRPHTLTATVHVDPTAVALELAGGGDTQYSERIRGVFLGPRSTIADAASRFNNVQVSKRVPEIVRVLKHIEPALITLQLGADNSIYADIGLASLIPLTALGDGLLRILNIIVAIYDSKDGVVLVDEIENGLHYSSLDILWKALSVAANTFNTQLFAASHSLDCVRSFAYSTIDEGLTQDCRFYRLERQEHATRAEAYDLAVLRASLDSGWEFR